MNRLAIFPYNHDSKSIINFRDMLSGYVLSGIFLSKEDKYRQNELYNQNVTPILDLESSVDLFDTLLLCDNVMHITDINYTDKITAARRNHKMVLMNRCLLPLLGKNERSSKIKILDNQHPITGKYTGSELLEPLSPIAVIFGQGENCDKFDTELSFARTVISRGYHPAVITSNSLGSLFGMFTYPDFMFENTYSFEQKVILMNQYIYDIDQVYRPDIIIIGIPGGYMPLDPITNNHFGEFTSIIASALPVVIDIGILTIYMQNSYPKEFLNSLPNLCKSKFDFSIDLLLIARQSFEYNEELKRTNYYFYDDKFLQNNYLLDLFDYPYASFACSVEVESSFHALINKLESNVEII